MTYCFYAPAEGLILIQKGMQFAAMALYGLEMTMWENVLISY